MIPRRYYLVWLFVISIIGVFSAGLAKVTGNIWLGLVAINFLLFMTTERNITKLMSKKIASLTYVSVAIISTILVSLFDGLGILISVPIMIAIALKITWEYHREEREKDNIKREKAQKKKQRQYRDLVKQRKKQREENN